MAHGMTEQAWDGGNMAWKYNPFTNELSYYEPISVPPVGEWKVVNFYVDSQTKRLIVEYEDET